MACYSPITGLRRKDGTIRFGVGAFSGGDTETVNCGNCIGCRLERSRQWSVRITHEAACHPYNSFLTLTYDNEHLPPHSSLTVRHIQLFLKNLRQHVKRHTPEGQPIPPVRYYQCGEYGEKKQRPHHHMCLMGIDFREDRIPQSTTKNDDVLYTSVTLNKLWKQGACLIGDLTQQSAAYVARYIMDKKSGPAELHYLSHTDLRTGEVVSRKKEFATMSLKPGIGAEWFKKFSTDVYPKDYFHLNGIKQRPPRYYDTLLERQDPELLDDLKEQRALNACSRHADNTPHRLRTREKCKELQIRKLKREKNL